MAVITINGREFPAPDVGGNLVVATNVLSLIHIYVLKQMIM